MDKRRLDVGFSVTLLVIVLASVSLRAAGVDGPWATGLKVLGWVLIAIAVGSMIRRYFKAGRF